MYSGLALSKRSGCWLGVHQKFDQVAYQQLRSLLIEENLSVSFPPLDLILRFEGRNGPDGLKIKSPGMHEPHHFYNPYQPTETDLLTFLKQHTQDLKWALVAGNLEKAAWEASWLAHVIVDGLTPAHHYPYREEFARLAGHSASGQIKVSDKVVIKRRHIKTDKPGAGASLYRYLDTNWHLWGNKGLILTHGLFEFGVALIVAPFTFKKKLLTLEDFKLYQQQGVIKSFKQVALQVADVNMYHHFYLWGWTPKLALAVKNLLAPLTIKMIMIAWLDAIFEAEATLRLRNQQSTTQTLLLQRN